MRVFKGWYVKTLVVMFILAIPCFAFAGTTGKIVGVVREKSTDVLLPAVSISLEGTKLGAISDTDGFYTVLNVPAGTYTLKAILLGYKETEVTNVLVRPDLTTEVNIGLEPTIIEVGEVITVQAERLLVQPDLTASRTFMTSGEIVEIPAGTVRNAVAQTPGVVLGSFRGGRVNSGEVVYLVDGISLQSPLGTGDSSAGDDALATELPTFSVEELEVLTGGFDAEYGNAQSAIVNVVTKEGGPTHSGKLRLTYSPEVLGLEKSGFESSKTKRSEWTEDLGYFKEEGIFSADRYKRQDVKLSLGGPNPVSKYLLPLKYFNDSNYFIAGDYLDTGGRYRKQHTIDWTIKGNLSFRPSEKTKLVIGGLKQENEGTRGPYLVDARLGYVLENYDLIVSTGDTVWVGDDGRATFRRPADPEAHWAVVDSLEGPDGEKVAVRNWDMFNNVSGFNREWSNDINLTFTHTISPNTFYEVRLSRFETGDEHLEKDPWDGHKLRIDELQEARFVSASIPILDDHYYISPNALQRWMWETKQIIYTLKTDITSQFSKTHMGKRGLELRLYDIDKVYHYVASGDNIYREIFHVKPRQLAAYVQEKFETHGMILNVGLRFDYFDSKTIVPGNPDAPVDFSKSETGGTGEYSQREGWIVNPERSKSYGYLSPRFGVSHPITDADVLHFTYGHFYQFPIFDRYFTNHTYNWDGAWKEIGNPNLKPEKTILYEAGIDHSFGETWVFDVTGFYKDIYDLIDLIEKNPGVGGRYLHYLYSNSSYGNVRGFEVSVSQRNWHSLSGSLSYTFQIARGKNSYYRQGFYDIYDRKVPRTQDYYLDWDQRHTLRLGLDYITPESLGPALGDWTFNAIYEYGSGKPYSSTDRGKNPPINDKRYPSTNNVDMKITKDFKIGRFPIRPFFEMLNVTNEKNMENIQDTEYYERYKDDPTYEPKLSAEERRDRAASGRFNEPDTFGPGRRSRIGLEIGF